MSEKTYDMLEQFKLARCANIPIMAIKTQDPEPTMCRIQDISGDTPIVQWDCIQGWVHRGKAGIDAITVALQTSKIHPDDLKNYSVHLEAAEFLPYDDEAQTPTNPILFVMNAHNYLEKPDFVQALWNLRDSFKVTSRTVVLLGPDFILPPELRQDIFVLDEPLPDDCELKEIVQKIAKDSGLNWLGGEAISKATDALRGLAAFPAEQSVAMSLTKNGLDIENLWERKRQMVSQSKGLTVWRGGEKFDSLGGLQAIKEKFSRIINGKRPPRVVVWVEEGEKQQGLNKNAGGDLSGTSTDQLATLLTEIVDKEYTGVVLDGVPGSGKSAFAKAFGNEAGILTIRLDLGGSKGEGLVGQAENEIRSNLKVIEAIGGKGGAFFIFTSNNAAAMDSALKSRMTKGVYFFDVPEVGEEKESIWQIYFKLYPDIDPNQKRPDDALWTGREIRACIMTADEEGLSLVEAARDIIPVAISDSEEIEHMRIAAHGKYNSASYKGAYDRNKHFEERPAKTRRVSLGE